MVTCLCLFFPLKANGDENLRESAIVKAVRKASPAVVNISAEYEIRNHRNPFSGFQLDPLFESFFKDFFDPGYERKYKRTSLGSGVIIDGKRGYVLTNAHVIYKTGTITILLNDEREFEAKMIGADPDSDLAVLKIDSDAPLPAIEMGDSDDLMIGESVIAIGNPFGFSNTVTTGVVSALHRSIRTDDHVYHDFIQTDASINPGNSGGPLQNINGELIGINTAIYAKAQGIGFAIPINKAKRVVADLIKYGEVIPVWLGFTVQDITEKLAGYLTIENKTGVIVTDVETNSPASDAGVRSGDVLLSLNNKAIPSQDDFLFMIKDYADGDILTFEMARDGQKIRAEVTASLFPLKRAETLAYALLGVKVKNTSDIKRENYTKAEGVVITQLRKNAYLAHIGVLPGDIIRQIDEITITDINDFKRAVIKYRIKKTVVVLLQRENRLYHITVKL